MPVYRIRGIDVDFPYVAYDSQLVYMEKVIQSLQEKCNALLESPTGTGKTLCLLCATLAWRRSLGPFSTGNGENVGSLHDLSAAATSPESGSELPKIVYTSRTHSQLKQVVQELKRTNYRPKMVVLGSREQLCIHHQVSLLRGKAQNNACQYIRKRTKNYCRHYKLAGDYLKINPSLGDEPIDIEDLVNIGKSCGPCPFYVSRELHKDVDILFAPYNYLIDQGYMKSLKIEWNDSILIFDEAHNLESICADASSFDLPSSLLTACISEAKTCVDLSIKRRERDNSNDKKCNPDNFAILRALLLKLEKRISEVRIESKELGFTAPGSHIYEILRDINVTIETSSKLIDILEEAALLLEEDANGAENKESHEMKSTSCRLEVMGDILKKIFRNGDTSHAHYYRVHVQETTGSAADAFKGKVTRSRTLSWWCFNPGLAMEGFARRGVGSVILTSGTLSPMDSFAHELKLEFPVRLENPHVISSDQIWAGVVSEGPSGYHFNSSYRSRDVLEYKQGLGNAIVNFARIVPDGLLVFFPSYYLMEQCISCWKDNSTGNSANSSTIWERICKHKQPVIEPRQSSLFPSSIEDFKSKLNDPSTSGAVFFAVCRGKVSEGLDFADHAGRAVVVTGLPFATRNDPKVRLKREYLDEQAQNQLEAHKTLTGEEWYDQQASRAVNQAVGRVIRHRHDYGAIIFCDERFASSHRQTQVSRWIQPHIKCYSKFGDIVYSLTRFFREGHAQHPSKPNFSEAGNTGNTKGSNTSPHLEALFSGKKFTVPPTQVDVDSCTISSSGTLDEKGNTSIQLRAFLPANRSSLAAQKQSQTVPVKHASHLFGNDGKLFLSMTNLGYKKSEIVDLTGDSSPDRMPEEKLIVPCSSKRQKILETKQLATDCPGICCESRPDVKEAQPEGTCSAASCIRQDKFRISDAENVERVQISSTSRLAGDITTQVRVPNKEDNGVSSGSCKDEEAKGAAFLIQVKKKLTAAEYGEFVGYMKALKSKAMTISPVLQSIAKLFSTQERLPLLRRFKDYIPGKYCFLYEQHCKSIEESAGTKR